MKSKVLILYNPSSGKRRKDLSISEIIDEANMYVEVVEVINILKLKSYEQLYDEFANQIDGVILCGGDGTINRCLNEFYHLEWTPWFLLVPYGSTNDIAASHQIPNRITEAIKLLQNPIYQKIDVGLINNEDIFIYALTFGNFTEVTYETPQELKNKLGHSAYWFYGITRFRGIRDYSLEIKVDDKHVSDEFVFGSITNAVTVANVFKMDNVIFDDGWMETLFIKKPTSIKEYREILRSLILKDYRKDMFFRANVQTIRWTSERNISYNVDGEKYYKRKSIEVKILKEYFTLVSGIAI